MFVGLTPLEAYLFPMFVQGQVIEKSAKLT